MRTTLIAFIALLALAAPAGAATAVRVTDAFPGEPFSPMVEATDETGDANTLSISYLYKTDGQRFPPPGDATVTVEDSTAPLEAGEGCQALGGNRVRCTVEGLVAIRARLGGAADTATALSPTDGKMSCKCVAVFGGDGNDSLTSRDGAALQGEGGDDTLTGLPSEADEIPGGLGSPNDDGLVGGPGDDVLDGGNGNDGLTGGPGDDVLYGRRDRPGRADRRPRRGPSGLVPADRRRQSGPLAARRPGRAGRE